MTTRDKLQCASLALANPQLFSDVVKTFLIRHNDRHGGPRGLNFVVLDLSRPDLGSGLGLECMAQSWPKLKKMAVIIAFFLIMCRLVTLYVRGGFIYLKYIVIVEHKVFDPWALPKAITIQAGLGSKNFNFQFYFAYASSSFCSAVVLSIIITIIDENN